MNILAAQAVFIAVFGKAFAGIDHKDAAASVRVLFINHDNTGRNAGAIKQVGRQTDNAFDVALFNQVFTNARFGVATEQNAVRQNDRAFTGAF